MPDSPTARIQRNSEPTAATSAPPSVFRPSPFQWFLDHAEDSIYFVAFASKPFTQKRLTDLAIRMSSTAPALMQSFLQQAEDGSLTSELAEAIASLEETESFENCPEIFLAPEKELFSADVLPQFRLRAWNLRDGPDEQGRAALLMIVASHAIVEGKDLVLLFRSRALSREPDSCKRRRTPLRKRLFYDAVGLISVPIHLLLARFSSPPAEEMRFHSAVMNRRRLHRAASQLGVSKRALLFALVTHALHRSQDASRQKKPLKSAYITMDGQRWDNDDSFLQARMVEARFSPVADFAEYAREVDLTLQGIEQGDLTYAQFLINAIMKWHQRFAQLFPFLYRDRIFHYHSRYDLVLSLVPPARVRGPVSEGLMEPLYCGASHRRENLCVMTAGSDFVTFTLSLESRYGDAVEHLLDPLDELEAAAS